MKTTIDLKIIIIFFHVLFTLQVIAQSAPDLDEDIVTRVQEDSTSFNGTMIYADLLSFINSEGNEDYGLQLSLYHKGIIITIANPEPTTFTEFNLQEDLIEYGDHSIVPGTETDSYIINGEEFVFPPYHHYLIALLEDNELYVTMLE